MNLSLIKQFEGLLSKGDPNIQSINAYGEVVSVTSETTLVHIDGAAEGETIPVESAVPFVQEGDRVIVTFTNNGVYISNNFNKDIVARSLRLTGDSSINLNDKFLVDKNGNMTAKSGTFGGLSIVEDEETGQAQMQAQYPIEIGQAGIGTLQLGEVDRWHIGLDDNPHSFAARTKHEINAILRYTVTFPESIPPGETGKYMIAFDYNFTQEPMVFCQAHAGTTAGAGNTSITLYAVTKAMAVLQFNNDGNHSKKPTVDVLVIGV